MNKVWLPIDEFKCKISEITNTINEQLSKDEDKQKLEKINNLKINERVNIHKLNI